MQILAKRIIYLRHGERADYVFSETEKYHYDISYDPCLSIAGKEQAKITGEYLKTYLKRK